MVFIFIKRKQIVNIFAKIKLKLTEVGIIKNIFCIFNDNMLKHLVMIITCDMIST